MLTESSARFKFKDLVERVHELGLKEGLEVELLYGLSKNFNEWRDEYESIIKTLGPYIEYEKKLKDIYTKYKLNKDKCTEEVEKLKTDNKKLLDDIQKFLNEIITYNVYPISYTVFPQGFFKDKTIMDPWMPILKD